MAQRSSHDPLNLVRCGGNALPQEAALLMRQLDCQKRAVKESQAPWKDEFDEIENDLDRWKQRRKPNNPPETNLSSNITMNESASNKGVTQSEVRGRPAEASKSRQTICLSSAQFQLQKPEENNELPNFDSALLRRNNQARQAKTSEDVQMRLDTATHKPPADGPSSDVSRPNVAATKPADVKDYVHRSESRFQNAKSFFENNLKQAPSEVPLRKPRSGDNAALSKRMSWAPGMIGNTYERQSSGKLSIANDKEFTIEEFDLKSPKPVLRASESRGKFDYPLPRFVPNPESIDDSILRRKKSSGSGDDAAKRVSRTEIISMDLSEKQAVPELSLSDFQGIITSPVVEGSGELKEHKSENTFFEMKTDIKKSFENISLHQNVAKDSYVKSGFDIRGEKKYDFKYSADDLVNKSDVKNTHETNFSSEEVQSLNDKKKSFNELEFKTEIKNTLYKKDLVPNEVDPKIDDSNVNSRSTFFKNNFIKFDNKTIELTKPGENASNDKDRLADDLKRIIEDKKAYKKTEMKDNIFKRTDIKDTVFTTNELVRDSAFTKNPEASKQSETKPDTTDQGVNPFKAFDETYKTQLEELSERKLLGGKEGLSPELKEDEAARTVNLKAFEKPVDSMFKSEKSLKICDNYDKPKTGMSFKNDTSVNEASETKKKKVPTATLR